VAGTPDVAIQVDGLDELRKAFREAGDKVATKELGKAGKDAADIVAKEAASRVPVLTGAARKSVRAVVAQGGGAVREGGPKAEYVPWLDFGGRVGRNRSVSRPFIKLGRYVYPALNDRHAQVVELYDDLVDGVLKRAGLT
jgi:HK97 gp10 family phage protein